MTLKRSKSCPCCFLNTLKKIYALDSYILHRHYPTYLLASSSIKHHFSTSSSHYKLHLYFWVCLVPLWLEQKMTCDAFCVHLWSLDGLHLCQGCYNSLQFYFLEGNQSIHLFPYVRRCSTGFGPTFLARFHLMLSLLTVYFSFKVWLYVLIHDLNQRDL